MHWIEFTAVSLKQCCVRIYALVGFVCVTQAAVRWEKARGAVNPGERTGPKPRLWPSFSSLLPLLLTLCCHGMSLRVTVSLATQFRWGGCIVSTKKKTLFKVEEGEREDEEVAGGSKWYRLEQAHQLHRQSKQLSAFTCRYPALLFFLPFLTNQH